MIANYFVQILKGLEVTLSIFGFTLLLSLPLGIIVALLRLSRFSIARRIMGFYIWVFRGTPLLLQVMVVFFVLPMFSSITIDRLPSTIIAFVLNYAAYFGEIFRAGTQSIERGQREVAAILGFTPRQIQTKIILPQVIKRTIPAVGNEIIALVKDTSLAYIVGVDDVLKLAKGIANRDATLLPYLVVAVIFLAMTFVVTKILDGVEKRINYEE